MRINTQRYIRKRALQQSKVLFYRTHLVLRSECSARLTRHIYLWSSIPYSFSCVRLDEAVKCSTEPRENNYPHSVL